MATEIRETGITIDHDLGQVRLDTSDRAMASWAIRTGFQETTTRESHPYRRFVGTVRQVRLARPEKSLGRIAAGHRLREARRQRPGASLKISACSLNTASPSSRTFLMKST